LESSAASMSIMVGGLTTLYWNDYGRIDIGSNVDEEDDDDDDDTGMDPLLVFVCTGGSASPIPSPVVGIVAGTAILI